MESLYRYYLAHLRNTREQFVAAFAHVYLYRAPSSAAAAGGDDGGGAEGEDITVRVNALTNAGARGAISLDEGGVVEVRKRINVPPFNRLTIGRLATNDLVLPFADVSKVHAEFHVADHRVVALRDRGSSNGTTVDGRALEPDVQVPVAIGCYIAFGPVGFEFVDGAGLYERVTALWTARGAGARGSAR